MRKVIGWICYALGAFLGVVGLQLLIQCELLSAFNQVENFRFDFGEFLLVTSGHHRAYNNGLWVHLARDLFLLGWALVIIRAGRQQFAFRARTRARKGEMVACPQCQKITYRDAYCRFCGCNLVTYRPSRQALRRWPVWQLTLLAYSGVSLFLLILNLFLVTGS
jgi:hypothetical protein